MGQIDCALCVVRWYLPIFYLPGSHGPTQGIQEATLPKTNNRKFGPPTSKEKEHNKVKTESSRLHCKADFWSDFWKFRGFWCKLLRNCPKMHCLWWFPHKGHFHPGVNLYICRAHHNPEPRSEVWWWNLRWSFDGKCLWRFPLQKKLENLLPNFAGSSPPISPKTSPTSLWKSLALTFVIPKNFGHVTIPACMAKLILQKLKSVTV